MNICITRSNKEAYSETFITRQINELSHKATVFPIHTGWLPEYEENNRLLNPKLFWLIHKVLKNIFKLDTNYFGNFGIKKYLIKNKIDIVLANYGISGVKLLPICRSLKIPLVVYFYGFDAFHHSTLAKYKKSYLELFNCASAIIVVSEDMREQLIGLGAQQGKLSLIPCGADIEKFSQTHPALNKPAFIAIGRFTEKKAPHLTIKAFHKVNKIIPDARLVMIGEGEPLFDQCKKLVQNLELENTVEFAGKKTHQETVEYLKKARAFVQHSITADDGDKEGTPVAILEAEASGLPIVSTLHGGIKDAVIHEKTGFLVKEGDTEAMGEYMIKLAQEPELADQMGKEGRAHVQLNYELNQQIEKLYNVLVSVVK